MVERALITGGTGFIGQALATTLRAGGVPVRVLVRPGSLEAKARRVARLQAEGVTLAIGDVLDPQAVAAAVGGATHVFHLAGQLQEPGIAPETYRAVHVDGTRHVLQACAQQPQPPVVVHCSTAGVSGPTGQATVTEISPIRPVTTYEITKARGERLARRLARQHGVPLVVVRPGLVYGPGDYHLLGWFRAIARGYYRVIGSGRNQVHPVYIDDVVAGLLCCAGAPTAWGQTYHLVGERPVALRAMAAGIAHALGRNLPAMHIPTPMAQSMAALLAAIPGLPPRQLPLTHSRINFMVENRAYCGCQIARDLSFRPAMALAEGLRRTVEWYRREGLL